MEEGMSDEEVLEWAKKRDASLPRGAKPSKKRGVGRARTSNLFQPDKDDVIKVPRLTARLPPGRPPLKIQIVALPRGPYKTQFEKWNAIFMYQAVNIERVREGIRPFTDKEIRTQMCMSPIEIEREISTEGYKKLRLAKAASWVQQTIADVAPIVRRTITEVAAQIESSDKCEYCQRVGVEDLKKKQEWLQFVVQAMDKFGLDKIDVSYADSSDDLDIDQEIAEAVAIIEDAKTWPNLAPQRVVKALVESNVGREKRKIITPDTDTGTHSGDADARPDEIVHPVQPPEAVVPVEEKIPSDDKLEPTGEDRLVDGRFNVICKRPAPDSENPQERGDMDISGEERQDTTGPGTEVPGETRAERIQMGI